MADQKTSFLDQSYMGGFGGFTGKTEAPNW